MLSFLACMQLSQPRSFLLLGDLLQAPISSLLLKEILALNSSLMHSASNLVFLLDLKTFW